MIFADALRHLFGNPMARRSRRRSFAAAGESLENRTMLTAYVLDSAMDQSMADAAIADGQLTLREAIVAANTNAAFGDAAAGEDGTIDRIFFSPAAFGDGLEQTITLVGGELLVTDDLRIDGSDRGVTIDAGGESRIFNVSDSSFEIGSLTLTGAVGDFGGAINAIGSDTVVDEVVFVDNEADGASNAGNGFSGGGAIWIGGGSLDVTGSTFIDNTATAANGSGGAIFLAGAEASVFDSTFGSNDAMRAGGAIEVQGSTLELTDGVAIANSTGAMPGNGGMLHVTGGGSTVIVRGGDFLDNFAAAEGGALWNAAGSTLTVFDAAFVDNIAAGGDADQGGGAIFNDGGTLNVNGASFDDNSATGASGSGGAILSLDGDVVVSSSQFRGNSANRAGGGIELVAGTLALNEVAASGNTVGNAPGNGGFYHATAAAVTTVRNGQYLQNTAAAEGGAFWNSAAGELRLTGVSVLGNLARGLDADQGGGGVFNDGGTLVIRDSTIADNRAVGTSGSGGGVLTVDGSVVITGTTLRNNRASRAGGGIEIIDGALTLDTSTLTLNRVANAPGNGGGIHVTGNDTRTLVRQSLVTANRAGSEGGGLWNESGSRMRVVDSLVINNIASGAAADNGGGGVFNNGGIVSITGSRISNNRATGAAGSGGGVFSTGGSLEVLSSTISRNTANRAGGGVEAIDGLVYLGDVTLGGGAGDGNRAGSPNAAPGNGGGLHISGTAATTVDGGIVSGNIAAAEGGGLWNEAGAQMVVRNGTVISRNIANGDPADQGGGGIFNNGGRLIVRDATLLRNAARGASGSGGGIFSLDTDSRTARGTLEVVNSTFQGNTANRAGGGIEVKSGTTFIVGTNFLGNQTGVPSAAPGNGGALHVTDAGVRVTLRGGLLVGNTATNEGGGLWNAIGSTMIVDSQTHVRNTAGTDGGAVFNLGNLSVLDSDLYRNVADADDDGDGEGGALFAAQGSRATLSNVTLGGNLPSPTGGPGRIAFV